MTTSLIGLDARRDSRRGIPLLDGSLARGLAERNRGTAMSHLKPARKWQKKVLVLSFLFLLAGYGYWGQPARQWPKVPVVMISIDGLKPDYVLHADEHGLKIPHLRRFLKEGAFAAGVKGVVPTVTYPSHTTLVTGVSPSKHGILANTPFDPYGKNWGGWYWYAEDIRVPTLWDAAAAAGLTTANVDWPVTVGADITYNIPQYWRAESADDHKIMRALSRPAGLLAEAEKQLGSYPEGNDYTVAADQQRARFNVYLLEKKKPRLLLCYFSGLDTEEHKSGPYSPGTFAVLEQIDTLVGRVRAAAERVSNGEAVICVVSDHGFFRVDKELRLNSVFREEGLLELNEKGRVSSWKAFAWSSSGSAAVLLSRPNDTALIDKTRTVLRNLFQEPNHGIHSILDKEDIARLGGFPNATFLVGMRQGFKISEEASGPRLRSFKASGSHGFLPDQPEMNSVFFISGPGIPSGLPLGVIDMRDIAPTLADILSITLPQAEGRVLFGDR